MDRFRQREKSTLSVSYFCEMAMMAVLELTVMHTIPEWGLDLDKEESRVPGCLDIET